jgi:hypothetical protein
MHHLSLMAISVAMFVIVLIVASIVCMVEALRKDKSDGDVVLASYVRKVEKRKKYERVVCADCGRTVSLRKDGEVHGRHHCHIKEPA